MSTYGKPDTHNYLINTIISQKITHFYVMFTNKDQKSKAKTTEGTQLTSEQGITKAILTPKFIV